MENILILSYYYPPCKGVSAYRPLSWAKDFHKFGFKPTIITRKWKGQENKWEDYLEEAAGEVEIIETVNSKIIYLPYKRNRYLKLAEKKWIKCIYFNKLIFFYLAVIGKFQLEIDAYTCFKDYLFNHLKNEHYKLIIVSTPPLNSIRLVYEAHKKFNIPFVIDFQDSWNNLILAENYSPGIKEKFYNFLRRMYLRRWLKPSLFNITVTPAIGDMIKKINAKPVKIITNGFEPDAYLSKSINPSSQLFNISVMGTIHPMQDISIMIDGLNLFLKDCDSEKVRLNFIGLDSFPEMSKYVKEVLPNKFLSISARVSMEEAVEQTLASNILLFPSYKGYKGYYTAKIFEYLGAGRNILMVPGNNDIVDDLIKKTNSGKIANSPEEFKEILLTWYKEWQTSGTIKYYGIKDSINQYTRENQNRLLCEAIKEYIS